MLGRLLAAICLLVVPAGTATAADWTVPNTDTLPHDAFGETVRAGRDLITHTTATIGPDAKDPAMRYAGNGLECQSCHLQAGTKEYGLPLAGIWGVFPTFIGRENEVRTLEERINGCMDRSMNGRPLPPDGAPMKAMLAYIRFISSNERTGQSIPGRGAPRLPLPAQASDRTHGAEVYKTVCAACHQADGHGLRSEDPAERHRYVFPPLWGPDSYNDGAGMSRPITAAQFIDANMPNGTDFTHPVLKEQDAFDVAAYIDGQPRPHLAGTERDFPDRALKPVDATYPPFLGPFPVEQHLVGPWTPMQAWMKANAAALRAQPAR